MASIFRRKMATKAGKKRLSTCWYIAYSDEHGQRRVLRGLPGKAESQLMAARITEDVALKRRGIIDPVADRVAKAEARSIAQHLDDWRAHLEGKASTKKHVGLHTGRVRRLLEMAGVKRLSDLTAEVVRRALGQLRQQGMGLATVNAYRGAVCSFSRWLSINDRLYKDPLGGKVEGYTSSFDQRHERRTIGTTELLKLIRAAETGRTYAQMSGRARALVYRLATTTGLRWSEVKAAKVESFHLEGARPFVAIEAAYTKNRKRAELALTAELAQDLGAYLSGRAPGPAFDLPARGSEMLKVDLRSAGIEYCDASGRYFDFHSLRCETATLADLAGASPRTVQHLMRHSDLRLTGRYTRPRASDLDAAVGALPSLRPTNEPEALRATGTDGRAAMALHHDLREERKSNGGKGIRLSAARIASTPTPPPCASWVSTKKPWAS
jgi:integrase